jgi:hypothetical protein
LIGTGVDHGDGFPGAIEVPSWVQGRQQIFAHVKLFGQAPARAGVGQLRNVLHVLHLGGELAKERPCDILVRDGVCCDHRTVVRRKLRPDVGADLVGPRQLPRLFVGQQRMILLFTERVGMRAQIFLVFGALTWIVSRPKQSIKSSLPFG